MTFIEEKNGAVFLKVHIQPRASKNEFKGKHGGRIKIRLKAPPVEGKANDALIEFLSDVFDAPKSGITIVSGLSSRQKTVKLVGIAKNEVIKVVDSR